MDDNESKHGRQALTGIIVAGLVLGFLGFRVWSDRRVSQELNRPAEPATWARTPTTNWPRLVLMQTARFKSHTELEGGCASLVRLPSGEIGALTAGHLLGKECGVKPGFLRGGLGGLDTDKLATLDNEIVSWRLFPAEGPQDGIDAAGLFGKAGEFDRDCDQVLLRLSSQSTNLPVTPLAIRARPTEIGEELWVVGFEVSDDGVRQVVRAARRLPSGLGFTCELVPPADMNGWSGAPVIDRNGLLVAIVTGGTLMDLMSSSSTQRGFTGHEIAELKSVLKAGGKGKRPDAGSQQRSVPSLAQNKRAAN